MRGVAWAALAGLMFLSLLPVAAQTVRPVVTPRTAATLRPVATARYPSGVTLDTIPGLAGRWAADDIVGLVDGDPVANWINVADSKTFTQATANNRPVYKTAILNSKPVVRCTNTVAGQFDTLQITASPSTASAGALYSVLIPRETTASNVWFSAAVDNTNRLSMPVRYNTGDGLWREAARSIIGNLHATGYTQVDLFALDTPAIIRIGSTGAAWKIRVNATAATMTGFGSRGGNNGEWFDDQVFTTYSLCGLWTGNSTSLGAQLDIAEFIVVDGAQWETDDDAVFTLLNTKYAVY